MQKRINGKHSTSNVGFINNRLKHISLLNIRFSPTKFHGFKGTVQRELRWVEIGINRTARINCIAGKCHLPCPKGHHHESSLNVIGACILFNAIPTAWISNISQRHVDLFYSVDGR